MNKSIFAFILGFVVFARMSFYDSSGVQFSGDSLKSGTPQISTGTDNSVDAKTIDQSNPSTDPDAVYPVVVNPKDLPVDLNQNTEVHEVGKHTPPGGEKMLEELKSKDLPYDPSDSSVIRVEQNK